MSISASDGTAKVVLIENNRHDFPGVTVTTAKGLREMFMDMAHNNGGEFAYWAEMEAKRAADIWRKNEAEDALPQPAEDSDAD